MPNVIDPTQAIAPAPVTPVNVATGGLLTTPVTMTPKADLAGNGYSATTGTSTGFGATKWTIDKPQTVAGQVADITTSGSPLMQRAETRANLQMNKRGLLNSSMALQAGQSALYDAALPIAQSDAQVNAQSANFNANAENAASQFAAESANRQTLANQDATNRAAEFGAGARNQAAAANQEATNRASEQNATAGNRLIEQSNTINAQANQTNAEAANKLLAQDLDNRFKVSISNADAASKVQLQTLSDTTKRDLAAIESSYKQMISSNEQAGALYGKVMQNITDIVNNPDISAADKTTAIENQKTLLKTGMNVVSAVSGLELGAILTFDGTTTQRTVAGTGATGTTTGTTTGTAGAASTTTGTTAGTTTGTTTGTAGTVATTTPTPAPAPAPAITEATYKATDWTKYATPEAISNSPMFNAFITVAESADPAFRALVADSDAALNARNAIITKLNDRNAYMVSSGKFTQAQIDNDPTAKSLNAALVPAEAAYMKKNNAQDAYWQSKFSPIQKKIAGLDAYLRDPAISDADRAAAKALLAKEVNAKFKLGKPLAFS